MKEYITLSLNTISWKFRKKILFLYLSKFKVKTRQGGHDSNNKILEIICWLRSPTPKRDVHAPMIRLT